MKKYGWKYVLDVRPDSTDENISVVKAFLIKVSYDDSDILGFEEGRKYHVGEKPDAILVKKVFVKESFSEDGYVSGCSLYIGDIFTYTVGEDTHALPDSMGIFVFDKREEADAFINIPFVKSLVYKSFRKNETRNLLWKCTRESHCP